MKTTIIISLLAIGLNLLTISQSILGPWFFQLVGV